MISEQMHKRLSNRNLLLRELHFHGPLSRSDIAIRCHIRKSSVTGLVAELLREGVVSELEPGRLRSQLTINGQDCFVLTGCVTEDGLHLARVGLDGRMTIFPPAKLSDRAPQTVLAAIAKDYGGYTAPGCLGFSLAFSGIIDRDGQQVLSSAHMMSWNHYPLVSELTQQLHNRVWLINDIHSQMLACNWFHREITSSRNILYIGIDEGIACRLTAQDRELPGEHGAAGEIGHIRLGREGRRCGCGKLDCLESYCSVPAIAAAVNALLPEYRLTASALELRLAAERDLRVRNVLDREIARLAEALVPIMAAVDPGCILLATADADFSKLLAGRLRQLLAVELAGILPEQAQVVVAPPILESTLQGAAVPAIRELFLGGLPPEDSAPE